MDPFDRIVVGVDGSPASAAGLCWASRRLSKDGELHVVHAFTPIAELAMAALQIDWVPLREEARQKLEGPWTEALTDCSFETHLIDDDPADALLVAAERYGATTIVVGAHGTPLTHRRLLGGVTRKLLHGAKVPVVVVHRSRDEPDETVRPIVACIGYGKAAEAAARWATDCAVSLNRPLELLHSVSNRPFYPKDSAFETLSSHLGPGATVEWAQSNLDRLVERALERHPDLVASTTIKKGSASQAIMNAGETAELVVLGNGMSNIIGPRAKHVLTFGDFATAVVPTCETSR
ncbi:MAG: universal stress protein [Acidimicrobiales bacterium]